MTDKVTLANVISFTNDSTAVATVNANMAAITTAMDNTLSRDGTSPNQMGSTLDMNSNQIINLPAPATVNSPARLADVTTNPTITVPPTGTSGATVPFNNGNNSTSGNNTYSGTSTFTGPATFTNTATFSNLVLGANSVGYNQLATAAQFLNNNRLSKIANYTVQNVDKGNTIALGGNLLYTLTFNAASGYDSNFSVLVVNEDSGRGKVIACSGLNTFILWPNQSVIIYNDNNIWKIHGKTRWDPGAGIIFNVDNVNGSDSVTNDGLGAQGTSGAFATIQHAYSTYMTQVKGSGCVIKLPDITATPITEAIAFAGPPNPGVPADIEIQGNVSNPLLCQWITTSSVLATIADWASVTFNGIQFGCSNVSAITIISCRQFCVADVHNCAFGNTIGGAFVSCADHSGANILGNITINGGCGAMFQIARGGHIEMASCDFHVVGSPNIGIFAQILGEGNMNISNITFTGGASLGGQQYLVNGGCLTGDSSASWASGLTAGAFSAGGFGDAGRTNYTSVTLGNTTVAGLPSASLNGGLTTIVLDATVTTFASVVAGGGSNVVPVYSDGSNWRIG